MSSKSKSSKRAQEEDPEIDDEVPAPAAAKKKDAPAKKKKKPDPEPVEEDVDMEEPEEEAVDEELLAKYKHAASAHFDPKKHLKKIGLANQTTMYKKVRGRRVRVTTCKKALSPQKYRAISCRVTSPAPWPL